jgi:uncharacterized membrane protein YphA (DoxX/SURF4 family)
VYFEVVLVLLGLRLVCLVGYVAEPHINIWNTALGAVSDMSSLVFGIPFGLALRRDRDELITEDAIFAALTLATAFFFAMTGVGKAFSMDWMTNFFHQSGYSVAFLKSIMLVEVFAALALLVPATVMPAILVLTVDMFGAIYTHMHNGDPLNDSTDAIRELIHLAAIAALWIMRRRARQDASHRVPWLALATGGTLCLVIAVAGGILMRRAHP